MTTRKTSTWPMTAGALLTAIGAMTMSGCPRRGPLEARALDHP